MEKLKQLDDLIKEMKQNREERQRQQERNRIADEKGQSMDETIEGNQTSLFKQNNGEKETTQCANATAETVQK